MKKKLALLFWVLPLSMLAQQYNVSLIPDSLRKHSSAVVRFDERIWEIKSPGKATVRDHFVYTIFNEESDHLSKIQTSYSKMNTINSFTGELYDATGKELKRMKKKDMEDFGGSGDESLMSDTRYKVGQFFDKTYPYTVDFEEEDERTGIMGIGAWVPQRYYNVSVQHTRFIVIAPKDYQLRYQAFNFSAQPVITTDGDKKIYTWEAKNLPAAPYEELQPDWKKFLPYVLIAPSNFEVDGYKGDMTTWTSYGKFYYDLYKGRDLLPDDIKKKVHEIADGIQDPKAKVAALYEFMQKNTHYISIQLGIGGWQPFDANFVATKRYGDCKALSNYMVALLKEAGIKAHSVVIWGGENEGFVRESFPSHQFNHCIACVPMAKDTVWLECTQQAMPAGYLSSFTADRYGLLIDETGGTLVRTPKYGLTENLQSRQITASLQDEGTLAVTVSTKYKGECQDELHQKVNYLSKEKLLEYLKSEIDLPTYDVVNFNYVQKKTALPTIEEHLELTAPGYAEISGKRLFVNPNILSRFDDKLTADDERKNPIELYEASCNIDTVDIAIPKGYQPESIPADIKIQNRFGSYSTSVKVQSDHIQYLRVFERNSGLFPASDYEELVKFYEKIYKTDRKEVVLVKKE